MKEALSTLAIIVFGFFPVWVPILFIIKAIIKREELPNRTSRSRRFLTGIIPGIFSLVFLCLAFLALLASSWFAVFALASIPIFWLAMYIVWLVWKSGYENYEDRPQVSSGVVEYVPDYNMPLTPTQRRVQSIKAFVKLAIMLALVFGVVSLLYGANMWYRQNEEAKTRQKYSACVKSYPMPNPSDGITEEYKQRLRASDFIRYCAPLDANPSGYRVLLRE